jgi:5-methylthioribose kinase
LFELSARNACEYLRQRGFDARECAVSELGGGVSNTVLLVEAPRHRFVLKQSLAKLRVEQDWFSDRGRIFRESAAINALAPHLSPGGAPEILFEDRENYLFAMSAAPQGAETWKAQLLAGNLWEETAAQVGRMLGSIARATWRDRASAACFGDQTVFDQLRLDPYYRSTAQRHPDLRAHFDRLLADTASRRLCLVHGDWSPKNFLVSADAVMAIDFEVVHFGDPAFDSGFLMNHLLLKAMYQPRHAAGMKRLGAAFWAHYTEALPDAPWVESATLQHLGCLMLARVDGKSPAEYLRTAELKARVRCFARELILNPPGALLDTFDRL